MTLGQDSNGPLLGSAALVPEGPSEPPGSCFYIPRLWPTMAVRALPVALLIALALSGCSTDTSDDGGASSSGGTGSASAYVKDAPSDDFAEVHVVFTEVSVHRSGGDGDSDANTTTTFGTSTGFSTSVGNATVTGSVNATGTSSANTTTASGPSAGWIVLFSDTSGVDVDLLNTTGARAAFLGESELAAGHYQQVRITVKEAYGIDHDGERVNITVASGTLKSVKSFEVEDGEETRVTIDIDLEKSLKQTGNGQWRMTPVIGKTSAAVVDDASSGEESSQPGEVESVPEAA